MSPIMFYKTLILFKIMIVNSHPIIFVHIYFFREQKNVRDIEFYSNNQ